MKWKLFGKKQPYPNGGTILALALEDLTETTKHRSQDTDAPAEIQPEHLPNASLQRYS
jgi:hypothetical protein